MDKPHPDPADLAEQFAHDWRDEFEQHGSERMEALGIPRELNGAPDYEIDGRWRAFVPYGRKGGSDPAVPKESR